MGTSVYSERDSRLEQQRYETPQREWSAPEDGDHALARALGWFSIGLGLAQITAPKQLSTLVGVQDNPLLFRLLGVRELASGLGILTQDQRGPGLWSRVAGDAMDLALLGLALGSEESDRKRVGIAAAAVAAVTALDLVSSRRESQEEPVRVRRAITINRTPEELYRFWRDFQNLPRFMKHLESVQVLDQSHSHWVAKGPAGSTVEWDAEMTEDRPNEFIAWRSLEGADVENNGSVSFHRTQRGTEVHVDLTYLPPAGSLGSWAAWLLGEEPGQQVQDDLRRLKQVMETGEVPTTRGQPSGPSRTALVSKVLRRQKTRGGMNESELLAQQT